jgi:hypothetical protein
VNVAINTLGSPVAVNAPKVPPATEIAAALNPTGASENVNVISAGVTPFTVATSLEIATVGAD